MAGAFETATRAAIAEIIQTHAQESKFGFILTRDGLQDLTNDLFDLLLTSRNLKSAGDRFLQTAGAPGGVQGQAPGGRPRARPR
jgi:hypothetical protein